MYSNFSTVQAIQIIEGADDYPTICTPPCKPKAGEVYLYNLPADKAGKCLI